MFSAQGKQTLRVEKQASDKVYLYPEILNRGCQVGSRWSPCHFKNTPSFHTLPNIDQVLNECSSLSGYWFWHADAVSHFLFFFFDNLSLCILMHPNHSRNGGGDGDGGVGVSNSCGPLCTFEQCSH